MGLDRLAASTGGGYAAIRALPERALLAGWPSGMVRLRPMDHGPTGPRHLRNSSGASRGLRARDPRRRTEAVIEAFYGCDSRPLLRLRDEFGVSHFVVDLELARTRSAEYFAPFDLEIRRARGDLLGRELEILQLRDSTAIYQDETVAILDLKRLPASR